MLINKLGSSVAHRRVIGKAPWFVVLLLSSTRTDSDQAVHSPFRVLLATEVVGWWGGGRAGGLPCVLSLITGGPPRAVAATIPSGELCRARVLLIC